MKSFISYLERSGKRKNTIKTYITGLKTFIQWYELKIGKNIEPNTISSLDIRDYKDYLLNETDYKVTTINNKLESVKVYLEYLKSINRIKENPGKKIPLQKFNRSINVKWLDRNEKNRLLRYIEDPRLEQKNEWRYWRNLTIIYFMLMAGLRISEVAALTKNDIENGFINIKDGKGGKARKVPMNSDLTHVYMKWLKLSKNNNSKFLFMSQKNGQLTADGIQHLFRTIRNETGLSITPHTLRHTFCHDLIEKGASINYVAEVAGHSDIDTTKIYIAPSESEVRNVVEMLSSGKFRK